MRQISITEHRHSTVSSVYIDGRTTMANNREEIGKALVAAGVNPNQTVCWMSATGKDERVKASQWLPATPVKPAKKGKRK